MSLRKQTISAFKWNLLGSIISNVGTFIISIIQGRLLSPKEFGIIGMVTVVTSVSQGLIDLGFASAIIQKPKVNQVQLSTVFYINLSLSLLLYIVFYFLAIPISNFYNEPLAEPITKALGLLFVVNGVSMVQRSLYIKELKYNILAKISVLSVVISGILGIFSSINGLGVWALVVQLMSFSITSSLLLWLYSNWKPSLFFNFNSIKELFSFGIRIFASSILESFYKRLDTLIIGKVFNATTLGLYTRSLSFQKIVDQLSTNGLNVLFPAFSKMQNDIKRLSSLFFDIFKTICLLSFFFSGLLWLIAKPLFLLLLGEEWSKAAEYFKIIMIMGYAYPLSLILVNVIKSIGRSDIFLKLEVFKKLIQFPAFFIVLFYDVETFLYVKVILALLSVLLNIKYVSSLLNTKVFDYLKIILFQFSMIILPIIIVLLIPTSQFNNLSQILIIGSMYSILTLSIIFLFQKTLLLKIIQIIKN